METAVDPRLETHRRELTGYCYRMLGSPFEAEDAVQETMIRAWRSLDRFEGRSSVRSWLYRIATNVCYDALIAGQRRALPMDLTDATSADAALGPVLPEATWVQPVPDERVTAIDTDPSRAVAARDSIRLAFIAALQHLPPRQRSVLILREVLRWEATEVAELLDTSVASVTSALQRARATMAATSIDADDAVPEPTDAATRELLDRYMDAFSRYDIDRLVALLREDATLTMPPYDFWLRGAEELRRWWLGPGPSACRGSHLVATRANGAPAFGQYRPSGPDGAFEPFAIQVLHIEGDRIVNLDFFLDTPTLFPLFGLPLDGADLDR